MERLATTRAGYRRMEERLRAARAEYNAVVASNPEAAEAGDSSVWHDNFAYEENQRRMHQWARRVRDLQSTLARLEVVDPPEAPERVTIACRVSIVDVASGRERTYEVAGYDDGDPSQGRVSYNSPLGRALIGAEVGEELRVMVGKTTCELEVVAIRALPEGH